MRAARVLVLLLPLVAAAPATGEPPVDASSLREGLVDAFRREPRRHAYTFYVAGEERAWVELLADRECAGVRFHAIGGMGEALSWLDSRGMWISAGRVFASFGSDEMNALWSSYDSGLALLASAFRKMRPPRRGPVAPSVRLDVASSEEDDSIDFKWATSIGPGGEPAWLEEEYWARRDVRRDDAGRVVLSRGRDEVVLDASGAIAEARGVSKNGRAWRLVPRPLDWTLDRWRSEGSALGASPVVEPVPGFDLHNLIFASCLHTAERWILSDDGKEDSATAMLLAQLRLGSDEWRSLLAKLWQAAEGKADDLLNSPSNLKDGRPVVGEERVREILREGAVDELMARLRAGLDDAFSTPAPEPEVQRRRARFRPVLERTLRSYLVLLVAEVSARPAK
jgi:hypothetical protein